MKRMLALSTALLLGAFIANPAKAAVINGDFSAGLTGWDSLGDVAVSAGEARLSTASLDVDDFPAAAGAFNQSGNAAAPVGQPGGVETFAGLPLGQLDPDPANADALRRWTADYWNATHPHSAGGAYVNFMMDEGQDRVRATYGPNYRRLTEVKAQYDPANTFRINQNIRPAL